jgi:hypothetical protein
MSQTSQTQKTIHNFTKKAQNQFMKFLLLFLLIVSIIAASVAIAEAHQLETDYLRVIEHKHKDNDTEK